MSPVGSSIILGRRKHMGSIPTLGHATLENSTISCQTQEAAWFMTNVLHISKIYVLKVLFGRSANRFQTYHYNIAIFINLHHLDFFGFSMTDISTVASFCSSPHIPASIQCFRNEKRYIQQGLLTSHPQPGNLAQKDCPAWESSSADGALIIFFVNSRRSPVGLFKSWGFHRIVQGIYPEVDTLNVLLLTAQREGANELRYLSRYSHDGFFSDHLITY